MLLAPSLFLSPFLLHGLFLYLDPFLPDQPPLEIHLISPLLILLILPQKLKQLVLIIQKLLDLAEIEHGLQVQV